MQLFIGYFSLMAMLFLLLDPSSVNGEQSIKVDTKDAKIHPMG
jgi:hypothetical protein